jgi:leucyl/phenylalanyl-tRNA---protein transferase
VTLANAPHESNAKLTENLGWKSNMKSPLHMRPPIPRINTPTMIRDLQPDVLIRAYCNGAFPMAERGHILWFSPEMRGLIPLDERFHLPRRLRSALRHRPFEIRIDADFEGTMRGCAERESTWIDEQIIEAYTALFSHGVAHSIECWDDDGLQGGLYGVALGGAFFGESMFSRKTNASKSALAATVSILRRSGFTLFDTQWITDHLRQFGAFEVPRVDYLTLLHDALRVDAKFKIKPIPSSYLDMMI